MQGLEIALGPGVRAQFHGLDVGFKPAHCLGEAIEVIEFAVLELLDRCTGRLDAQFDARFDHLDLAALGRLAHGLADARVERKSGALDRFDIELLCGEEWPALFDGLILADVLLLEHAPARIQIRGHDIDQFLLAGIVAGAHQRRQQEQAAKHATLDAEIGAWTENDLLRIGDRCLDFLCGPGHLFRQWTQRAEDPQHVIILADLPQARSRLFATDDNRLERADVGWSGRRRQLIGRAD